MLFCLLNVFVYAPPAHWMWASNGWLKAVGAVDVAGSGVIHLLGGVSGNKRMGKVNLSSH